MRVHCEMQREKEANQELYFTMILKESKPRVVAVMDDVRQHDAEAEKINAKAHKRKKG
ncbi:hypothetical protein BIW11_02904 [Tropilaelaps mercedesae]|uniref:Uncharacterized protein n=1 Tax=Tropilaelaps mercedesae TaxID=418985 RepID=A0A1V9XVD8_9ACAR|nr:hypothetical protein BIW11_02904 [Tropilaelaps mercedesae]